MMADPHGESLINAAQKGSIEECRFAFNKGADKNYVDSQGNTALLYAAQNGYLELVRFLISQGCDVNVQNTEGNTCLHMACAKGNKEMILLLLISGADHTKTNAKDEKPERDNTELKLFMSQITSENKAFGVLDEDQKRRLKNIFDDIDKDGMKSISLERSKQFNMFIEGVNEETAEKDAQDFISSCALCNKQTVNFDEWVFAFSKLVATDKAAFDKFIDDYEKVVGEKGPFRSAQL